MHGDMEIQIHRVEQEAYCSVLRAFSAQSDALTWDKETLITELRKELRVSDEEHRELLSRVNADDMIQRLREWRKTSGVQHGTLNAAQPVHDPLPSPTVSASRKKQKTSQSLSLENGAMLFIYSWICFSLFFNGVCCPLLKSSQYPSTNMPGRPQATNRGPAGAFVENEPAEGETDDPLVGRKVWTRWPEDNHFYEAVITNFNRAEGLHALVYDIGTVDETWEWVNLKEISPEDIRWEADGPGISRKGSRPGPGPGRGNKKSTARGGAVSGAGRGRGTAKGSKKDLPPQLNGIGRKAMSDIEILHTDSLIKEVEKVFRASHPDPMEIEKAKKVLKEHEQALVDAIARLEDASDVESGNN
ncbi:hypothetical protein D8674_023071 [Pyrus ussuriensis x Pyrus communis]|uniref:ENT domain-containing protein n=1 Tax=Pyrus ussuriensis x Pyrus communis TaxID=2448454 RepID=A0A5N5GNZ6_9ROSA|nr:hypothetical protein D8674_023071 [Pyrus ussuriensis x Pyrus communis]